MSNRAIKFGIWGALAIALVVFWVVPSIMWSYARMQDAFIVSKEVTQITVPAVASSSLSTMETPEVYVRHGNAREIYLREAWRSGLGSQPLFKVNWSTAGLDPVFIDDVEFFLSTQCEVLKSREHGVSFEVTSTMAWPEFHFGRTSSGWYSWPTLGGSGIRKIHLGKLQVKQGNSVLLENNPTAWITVPIWYGWTAQTLDGDLFVVRFEQPIGTTGTKETKFLFVWKPGSGGHGQAQPKAQSPEEKVLSAYCSSKNRLLAKGKGLSAFQEILFKNKSETAFLDVVVKITPPKHFNLEIVPVDPQVTVSSEGGSLNFNVPVLQGGTLFIVKYMVSRPDFHRIEDNHPRCLGNGTEYNLQGDRKEFLTFHFQGPTVSVSIREIPGQKWKYQVERSTDFGYEEYFTGAISYNQMQHAIPGTGPARGEDW